MCGSPEDHGDLRARRSCTSSLDPMHHGRDDESRGMLGVIGKLPDLGAHRESAAYSKILVRRCPSQILEELGSSFSDAILPNDKTGFSKIAKARQLEASSLASDEVQDMVSDLILGCRDCFENQICTVRILSMQQRPRCFLDDGRVFLITKQVSHRGSGVTGLKVRKPGRGPAAPLPRRGSRERQKIPKRVVHHHPGGRSRGSMSPRPLIPSSWPCKCGVGTPPCALPGPSNRRPGSKPFGFRGLRCQSW